VGVGRVVGTIETADLISEGILGTHSGSYSIL